MAVKTVLVVDDDADQRDITATFLRHHGYDVVEAAGGEEGIRVARDQQPDCILMDMMMADRDGWAVTGHLKQDPGTAAIPIVALTVRYSPEDQEKARVAGVDGYVVKPCLPGEVLAEVQRLVGPATGAEE
jgi:two-component system, cell cycle response regulator DivK